MTVGSDQRQRHLIRSEKEKELSEVFRWKKKITFILLSCYLKWGAPPEVGGRSSVLRKSYVLAGNVLYVCGTRMYYLPMLIRINTSAASADAGQCCSRWTAVCSWNVADDFTFTA